MSAVVFVSRQAALSRSQGTIVRSWCAALERRGLVLRTLDRRQYARDPWPQLHGLVAKADGLLAFGFRHVELVDRAGALASPWMQLEAGLAIAHGLPVLALPEREVTDGVFDPTTWGSQVCGHELVDIPPVPVLEAFVTRVGQRAWREEDRRPVRELRLTRS